MRTKHEWRDSMTRVTGPLVGGIQSAFAENWVYCTGEVLSASRFFPPLEPGAGAVQRVGGELALRRARSRSALLFWLSFAHARRRLWICNSYFIPDPRLREGGGRSRAPGRRRPDSGARQPHRRRARSSSPGRSYYEELLAAGVRIFEFLPSMMHAKTVVVDDAWSVVGSANMDERSMELNEENIVGIADGPFAQAVAEGLEQDFARSREVSWTSGARPVWQRGSSGWPRC